MEGVQVNGTDLTIENKKVNVTVAEGATNGTVAVNGTDVAVHGLGSAAYTDSTAYATSTQGGYADSALQSVSASGDSFVSASVNTKSGENGAKTQAITVATTTKSVASATSEDNGLATAADVKSYVDTQLGNLGTAVEFVGTSSTDPTSIDGPTISGRSEYGAGDVVLYGQKEYIYDGTSWIELGDEGSYALKTVTITAGTGLDGGGSLAENRTISLSSASQTSLGYADSALQSVTGGSYITVGEKTGNNGAKSQSVSVVTKSIAEATASSDGVALASDVKSAIEDKVGDLSSNQTYAVSSGAASAESSVSASDYVKVLTSVKVTETNGVLTAPVSGDVLEVAVDKAGAAAAVLGSSTDAATDMTVYGVKKALDDALGNGGNVAAQIQSAIEDLDKSDTAVAGKYVSAVSEEDGIITVTRADLPGVTFDASAAASVPTAATVEVVSGIGNIQAGSSNPTATVSKVQVATAAGLASALDGLDSAVNTTGSDGNIASTNTANNGTATTHVESVQVLTGFVFTNGKATSATSVTVEAISDADLASILVAPQAGV